MSVKLFPALRILGRLVKAGSLLGLAGCLPSYIPGTRSSTIPGQDMLTFLVIAAILCATIFGIWRILRSLRLALLRFLCQLLIRFGSGFLLWYGVWELLSVGVRIRNQFDAPDFTGLATLHKTYDAVERSRKAKILNAVYGLEGSPQCDVYLESVLFLEALESYSHG